jgi:hypothetical protein
VVAQGQPALEASDSIHLVTGYDQAMLAPLSWLLALPRRALAAPARLAGVSRDLGAIEEATRTLPDVERSMRSIASDTDVLDAVAADMAGVAEATRVLPPMDERMAVIEGAMPVLVEVQRHLARVPDTLELLEKRLGELSVTLDRLLVSLEGLDRNVSTLHAAVGPLSRLAGRFPGRSREPARD